MFVARWVKYRAVALTLALAAGAVTSLHAYDQFMKPTAEELSMTSLPGFPGAPAVVLFREEITKDDLHVMQHYNRIKILTEDGKKYANVELGFVTSRGGYDDESDQMMVGDIFGRTIHPDGTIVPFTGKPYLKVIEQNKGAKYQQKVFTLPDVTVGSIIEYRYANRYSDHIMEAPDWYIQGELFVKSAHYMWYPTSHELTNGDGSIINAISWFPILPPGAQVQRREIPRGGLDNGPTQVYELNVKDVQPKLKEEYMPPIGSFSYRVLFNFTPYRSYDEYWKAAGKRWSKEANSFIGPNAALTSATQDIIAGAKTQDEKLRKIYAAVMDLENTSFTREHDSKEDKAAGLGKTNNAADVLAHKRGGSFELTMLFVGMARAAGMKAYVMLVPDRSESMFTPNWQNMRQFDNEVAIVNVDGKDQFFDPGQRYCAYGHLAWQDTWDNGIRQTESGTDFAQTPGEVYTSNKTTRVANLTMDEHGQLTGKIDLTFFGSAALHWRQVALQGDEESTKHSLRTALEQMVPNTMEVKVQEIKNLTDYEKPLAVTYEAKGTVGTATGKRMVLPADLFVAGSSATFPHEKRELAVYFHYPQMVQDALRINFPKNITVEATPEASKFDFGKSGVYNMSVAGAPNSVTIRRNYLFNEIVVPKTEYPELRKFYSQFEAKDQDSVVLKTAPVESSEAVAPARN